MARSLGLTDHGDLYGHAAQHVRIQPQVGAGALQAVVPENVTDGLDPYALSEQPHGERVAKLIDVLPWQFQLGQPHTLLEQVTDPIVLNRTTRASRPQEQLWMCRTLSKTFVCKVAAQDEQRLLGQWQEQVATGLALHDMQHTRLPVDGVKAQRHHF